MDSNISFSSNVNIIRSASQLKGDEVFLKKVTDYDALNKLRDICGGNTNSHFYVFTYKQLKTVSPDWGSGYLRPKVDKEIEAENAQKNKEYGYSQYDEKTLFPLLDEVELDYGKSIWEHSDSFFWQLPGYYSDGDVTELSYWKEAGKQKGTVEVFGGGTLFTTYIKQELQRAETSREEYVPIDETEFPELDELDPYYYLYHKTAGVENDELTIADKEAKAYLRTYGIYSAFELTDQKNIIEAPYDGNIFVDAGPGTGKTYTLIQRINHLVEEQDVDPEGILVLCFSRAAVAEVKKRRDEYVDHGGSRGLRNVDIRTFHSFAWWLINEANENLVEDGWIPVNMEKLDYDKSIIVATSIIRRFREQVLGGWEHFIVDEIQDLTDVRAKLVLQIIEGCLATECGLTVLGDSCQAIYDYNQEDVSNPMDSTRFYEALFMLLYKKAQFYKLNINMRQTQKLISMTAELREAILNEKIPLMKTAVKNLEQRMSQTAGRNAGKVLSESYLKSLAGNGQICLLCRNNGQVLRLSAYLRERGIEHIVNAYDHTRCHAAWIGQVFSEFDKAMISQDEFADFIEMYTDDINKADFLWDKLSNIVGKPENTKLGTNELLQAIYSARLDDPVFYNHHDSKIIVSNIHKAKGREYDAVMVEKNFIDGLIRNQKIDVAAEGQELSEKNRRKRVIGEFKTLYVAVTRPKKTLYAANMVMSDGVKLYTVWKTGRKRWMKWINRELKYIEVRGNSDIDIESFNLLGNNVKRYIAANVKTGDPIILRKSKANEIFRYDIVHMKDEVGTVIGRCTKVFEDDIRALVQTDDNWQLPVEIRDLYVNDVFTHISENIKDDESALGRNNVWNWVDFCGFGRLVFDVY